MCWVYAKLQSVSMTLRAGLHFAACCTSPPSCSPETFGAIKATALKFIARSLKLAGCVFGWLLYYFLETWG